LFLLGCRQSGGTPAAGGAAGPPWFADVTQDVGLHFTHDAGPVADLRYFMPQIVGSGAALFDFDGDGRLDIYLVQNGGPHGAKNCLFRQGPDGRFTDVSAGSGLDVAGYGMGVAVGDVNNDGRPDVLLTEYGGARLFLNRGDGTFADITKEAGLDNPLWGTSAAFVDYDRDGWLDLVVVNYVDYNPFKPCSDRHGGQDYCQPAAFPGSVTRLYRNQGSADRKLVRFEDMTVKAGLASRAVPGLGVVCADFTGDGWPDIFVANDGQPNCLWVNRQDGTFAEEALTRGLAYNAQGAAQANMGIALGDVDGDGLFDVYVTHLTWETNTLWRQGPRGLFRDRTGAARLLDPHAQATGFGAVLADFDQDGAPDLAVVNGRVVRKDSSTTMRPDSFWEPYGEPNQLFANDGSGRFRAVSSANAAFCGTPAVGRGLACADVDGDGALDLLVTNLAGPARLYRNVAPNRGHWLLVRALDPAAGGRDAYGAEVTVHANGRRWTGFINPGYSYLCSNDPRAHFGLGETGSVESIHVRWPDGKQEVFPEQAADRVVVLRKGEGRRGDTGTRGHGDAGTRGRGEDGGEAALCRK
jgi:hypothetical protein